MLSTSGGLYPDALGLMLSMGFECACSGGIIRAIGLLTVPMEPYIQKVRWPSILSPQPQHQRQCKQAPAIDAAPGYVTLASFCVYFCRESRKEVIKW